MVSLEQALAKLVAKLTGRQPGSIPEEPEQMLAFLADNLSAGTGEPGPAGPQGEKGDPGPAGASVTGITLTADGEGKITGGTATLSDDSRVPITVTVE